MTLYPLCVDAYDEWVYCEWAALGSLFLTWNSKLDAELRARVDKIKQARAIFHSQSSPWLVDAKSNRKLTSKLTSKPAMGNHPVFCTAVINDCQIFIRPALVVMTVSL